MQLKIYPDKAAAIAACHAAPAKLGCWYACYFPVWKKGYALKLIDKHGGHSFEEAA